jgi:hypothetical protein
MPSQFAPQPFEDAAGAAETQADAAEFALDGQRVRGEIVSVGEGLNIAEFTLKVALELEYHRAEQRVGPTMHLGKPDLLIDREIVGAKRVMQQFTD